MVITLSPPFSLNTLNGNKLSLDHFCGEYLLVVFWETDCAGCERTLALLEAVHTSDDRITVLSVNMQPDEGMLREYVQDRGYSFPVLLDIEGKVFKDYQLKLLPTIIAINGRGEITFRQQGPISEENLKTIREILLEQWEVRPIIV